MSKVPRATVRVESYGRGAKVWLNGEPLEGCVVGVDFHAHSDEWTSGNPDTVRVVLALDVDEFVYDGPVRARVRSAEAPIGTTALRAEDV